MTGLDVPRPERFISASELGEYAYCRRAWWLRAVRGVTTEAQGNRFSSGHAAHRRHAWSLWWARALGWLAALLMVAALAALAWRTWQ
jgi:hypothetical protein